MNSLISVYLFGESPTDKVIVGKDGWFFYNSAANESPVDTLADFQGTNLYSEEQLEQIRSNLVAAREKLAEQGIEFVLFIAPNKEQVYADKMPDAYGDLTDYTKAQQIYDYIKDDIRVVYAVEDLIQARQDFPQYDFYCHLDTHWNNLGAYVGAKALMQELGHELPEIEQLTLEQTEKSGLDLSAMMNLTEFLNKDVNYVISGYSNNAVETVEYNASAICRYSTSGADSRKLLVIRDSFCTAMAPCLASLFNDTVLIHYSYYDVSYVAAEQPDIVIYESVERYLDRLLTFQIVE